MTLTTYDLSFKDAMFDVETPLSHAVACSNALQCLSELTIVNNDCVLSEDQKDALAHLIGEVDEAIRKASGVWEVGWIQAMLTEGQPGGAS